MTDDEFFDDPKRRKWREPFEPFVIELTSGVRVEIDDADGLAFCGGAGAYLLPQEKAG